MGVAVDYANSTITLICPTQIADLVKIFYPNNEEIPVTYTPAPTGWSEESRNDSPPMSLDSFRSAVGIFIFLSTIRFDSLNFTCRHYSRTRHHTELDWADMRHHVAYLFTTRLLGLIYYPRQSIDPIPFTIQGASDYGDRVFADGTGVLGVMIFGGAGLRGRSAPIMASSTKDRGVISFTTPDGELKAYVSLIKSILDMRLLAEDLGNLQTPSIAETDSQTVSQTAQDFTGRALTYRHRRRQLVFVISCVRAYLIAVPLILSDLMTADGLTKDYGPLKHWRRITYLLKEQPEITRFQQIMDHRFGGKKRTEQNLEETPHSVPLIALPTTSLLQPSQEVARLVIPTSLSPYQHRRGRKGKASRQRDFMSRSVDMKK